MKKDEQGPFPSHVPNQELKETIDHISLGVVQSINLIDSCARLVPIPHIYHESHR